MKVIQVALMILKTVSGFDVTKQAAKVFDSSTKPFWLSRRFNFFILTAIAGLAASITGIQVPETELNKVADNLSTIVDIVIQNKEIWLATWASILGVIGHFRRKKT